VECKKRKKKKEKEGNMALITKLQKKIIMSPVTEGMFIIIESLIP
jgi:hypothetical protein